MEPRSSICWHRLCHLCADCVILDHLFINFGWMIPLFHEFWIHDLYLVSGAVPGFHLPCTLFFVVFGLHGGIGNPVWPLQINTTGGCGSSLGSLMSILPGAEQNYKAPELDKCCNLRHACLQVCGIFNRHCDDAFLKCTDDVCNDTPKARLYRQCHKTLEVKMDHCDRYTKERADHCMCAPVEDVAATQREILTQFYRVYKPKDLAKIDALVDWAADCVPKMAPFLQQLVAKYHRARKSVAKPAASAESTTTSAEETTATTTEETTTSTTEEQPSTTSDEL